MGVMMSSGSSSSEFAGADVADEFGASLELSSGESLSYSGLPRPREFYKKKRAMSARELKLSGRIRTESIRSEDSLADIARNEMTEQPTAEYGLRYEIAGSFGEYGNMNRIMSDTFEDTVSARRWLLATRSLHFDPRGIIPQLWVLFMRILAFAVILADPFEVAFVFNASWEEAKVIFEYFGWLTNWLFFADLLFQLNLTFVPPGSIEVHYLLRDILRNYCFSFRFVCDLVVLTPMIRGAWILVDGGDREDLREWDNLKLLRLFALSKIFREYNTLGKGIIPSSFAPWYLERLMQVAIAATVMLHWMACGAFIVGRTEDTPWYELDDDIRLDADIYSRYIVGVYWATMTATTIGYGDIVLLSNNERIYAIVCMLLGAVFFAYSVGVMSNSIDEMEKEGHEFNKVRSRLHTLMKHHVVGSGLKNDIDYYLAQRQPMINYHIDEAEKQLLDQLSPMLQQRLLLSMHYDIFSRVDILNNLPGVIVGRIVKLLNFRCFNQYETVIYPQDKHTAMYVIEKGIALKTVFHIAANRNKLLYRLNVFGEGILLHPEDAKLFKGSAEVCQVQSVTFLGAHQLPQRAFFDLLSQYPEIERKFRSTQRSRCYWNKAIRLVIEANKRHRELIVGAAVEKLIAQSAAASDATPPVAAPDTSPPPPPSDLRIAVIGNGITSRSLVEQIADAIERGRLRVGVVAIFSPAEYVATGAAGALENMAAAGTSAASLRGYKRRRRAKKARKRREKLEAQRALAEGKSSGDGDWIQMSAPLDPRYKAFPPVLHKALQLHSLRDFPEHIACIGKEAFDAVVACGSIAADPLIGLETICDGVVGRGGSKFTRRVAPPPRHSDTSSAGEGHPPVAAGVRPKAGSGTKQRSSSSSSSDEGLENEQRADGAPIVPDPAPKPMKIGVAYANGRRRAPRAPSGRDYLVRTEGDALRCLNSAWTSQAVVEDAALRDHSFSWLWGEPTSPQQGRGISGIDAPLSADEFLMQRKDNLFFNLLKGADLDCDRDALRGLLDAKLAATDEERRAAKASTTWRGGGSTMPHSGASNSGHRASHYLSAKHQLREEQDDIIHVRRRRHYLVSEMREVEVYRVDDVTKSNLIHEHTIGKKKRDARASAPAADVGDADAASDGDQGGVVPTAKSMLGNLVEQFRNSRNGSSVRDLYKVTEAVRLRSLRGMQRVHAELLLREMAPEVMELRLRRHGSTGRCVLQYQYLVKYAGARLREKRPLLLIDISRTPMIAVPQLHTTDATKKRAKLRPPPKAMATPSMLLAAAPALGESFMEESKKEGDSASAKGKLSAIANAATHDLMKGGDGATAVGKKEETTEEDEEDGAAAKDARGAEGEGGGEDGTEDDDADASAAAKAFSGGDARVGRSRKGAAITLVNLPKLVVLARANLRSAATKLFEDKEEDPGQLPSGVESIVKSYYHVEMSASNMQAGYRGAYDDADEEGGRSLAPQRGRKLTRRLLGRLHRAVGRSFSYFSSSGSQDLDAAIGRGELMELTEEHTVGEAKGAEDGEGPVRSSGTATGGSGANVRVMESADYSAPGSGPMDLGSGELQI